MHAPMSSSPTILHRFDDGSQIEGFCDSRFEPVLRAFAENFDRREEVGACLSVTLNGEMVLDLWGGYADSKKSRPWDKDSLSVVFSATKGATALCAHRLVSMGLLDLDAPIAEYWPEFAREGKEQARVSMMLDHSVGVPVLRDKVKPDGFYDWDYMVARLEAEEAFWPPGTRLGYHGATFGWLVGELVRRVSGQTLGAFFQEQIAGPLGLDFWIGFPEAHEHRLVEIIQNRPNVKGPLSLFLQTALNEQGSIPNLFAFNAGGASAKKRDYRAAEIGSAGGVTNARHLAGLYTSVANGGKLNGVHFFDDDLISRMGRVSMSSHLDATLMIPSRFALGFQKSMDNRLLSLVPGTDSLILSDTAFGHAGMGGYLGFADPEVGLAFGYVMNRMGHGNLITDRGQALVDAVYGCLGFKSNASGAWQR